MLLLALSLCGPMYGQERDRTIFQFQHTGWTAKEGAPASAWGLAQTTDGYLWMATPAGLYRFDGIHFELYQPPSGQPFPAESMVSVKATPDGGLWIGFWDGDVVFLKDGRITRYTPSEGLPDGTVDGFALDKSGVVWAASVSGLARFDGSRWHTIGRDWGYSEEIARAVFVDREGTLWVTSEDALFYLSRGSREFRKYADHLGATTSIGQTPDGTLWLSEVHPAQSPGKLTPNWKYCAIRPTPVMPQANGRRLPPIMEIDAVNSAFIDHAGSLWIADNDGLFRVPYPERLRKKTLLRLDESTAQVFRQKDGLTSDFVEQKAVMEDGEGNIWVATANGLDRFRASNVVPVTADLHREILVAGNQGDAWTSVTNFPKISLVHLRGLMASSQPFPASLSAGYRDNHGMVWLAGSGGLWRLENGRLVRYPLPEAVTRIGKECEPQAITGDTGGGLWVSFACNKAYRWANGVWTWTGNRDDWLKYYSLSLLTDSHGRIWFGYWRSKIALLDRDHVTDFSAADPLQVGDVQAMYERGGRIWIGGGRGVALYKDNHLQSLIADGSTRFIGVSGIVATANGDLWLNATPGIFHIPAGEIDRAIKEPAYHVRCELFDALDGLNGSAQQVRPMPTAVASTDGLLWFATTAGVVQIDPNHLLRNTLPPAVEIRSVDSGGITHSGPGAINLPARTTSVHITYTAPNLSIPERVRYRYELEGSDKDWQDTGTRREAFYTNLGPGHYRFHVIACNEDGVWNTIGATINLTIAPAWFQTYWFFALCAGAALLAMWMLYRMRLRQVAHAMSVRFDERLQERTRLARDLHDTLLQTIQASKYVADTALRGSTDVSPMRGSMEELSEWLGNAIEEGRAAVNSLRTSTTERNDLAEALRSSLEERRAHGSVEAAFSVVGEAIEMHPIVRDEVYRIGYEAIRNACAHSQATHLQVELKYGENLTMSVRDNGVGIDAALLSEGRQGHFGLTGMRERADRIKAILTVETSRGFGTEIKLVVPGNIIYRTTNFDRRQSSALRSLLKRMGIASNSNDF